MYTTIKNTFLLLFLSCTFAAIGQNASSLNLDGVDDQITTPLVLNATNFPTGSWTIECWVKGNIPSTNEYNGPAYGDNLGIIWDHANVAYAGAATVASAAGTFYSCPFNLPSLAGVWYHLAATYDGTNLKAYKNGQLMNITVTNGGLQYSNSPLLLGRHPTIANFMNGSIDNMRVWNVARTACEIVGNMNSELTGAQAGLLLNYNFNEGTPNANNTSITTIIDQSGTNNGTISNFILTGSNSNFTNSAPFNASQVSCTFEGLRFDGVNDNVNTGVVLPNTGFTGITYECWVKGTFAPAGTVYNGPMYGDNFAIVWDHNNPAFRGAASVISASGAGYSASFGSLAGGVWYHLAATYDGTTLKAYKNGVLISATITNGGISNGVAGLQLGKHPTINNFFNGNIDEARIWNRAKTCTEIASDVNKEFNSPQANLVAAWNFNDGIVDGNNTAITTIADYSGNNNNGTLNNFTLMGTSSNFTTGTYFNSVAATPPAITAHPANTSTCSGPVNFGLHAITGSGGTITYQWQVNDGSGFVDLTNTAPYSGVNTNTLNISTPTLSMNGYTYRCLVRYSCSEIGSSGAAKLTVTGGIPIFNSSLGSILICAGTDTTLALTTSNTVGYQWLKDGIAISGATSSALVLNDIASNQTGDYSLIIIGNCGDRDTSAIIEVGVMDTVAISSQPITSSSCEGGNSSLSVAATGTNLSYQWYKDGAIIPGETTPGLYFIPSTLADSGLYYVEVTGTCNAVNSNSVIFDVFPLPQPVVLVNGNVLTSSITGLSYQWYLNGTPISAQQQSYTAFISGNYSVNVMSADGCDATSPEVNVIYNSVKTLGEEMTFSLYPNPVNDILTVNLPKFNQQETNLTIYDLTGKEVKNMIVYNIKNQINVEDLNAGLYLLKITNGTESQTEKFVKE